MICVVLNPGSSRAELVDSADAATITGVAKPSVGVAVRPLQYSRGSVVLEAIPLAVYSEHGKELDRVVITVSARTGKLSMVHLNQIIPSPVDDLDHVSEEKP